MTSARLVRAAARTTLIVVAGLLLWGTRAGTRWPAVYYMTGASMEPTVRARVLFLTSSPPGELRQGQLVIFEFTDEDGEEFHVLRRAVALPGDTVAMLEGGVIVNGRRMPWPFRILAPQARTSPYALVTDLYTWGPLVVGRDSVFLLSDTRDHLGWPDSRFIGPVPRNTIIAVAWRTLSGRSLAPARSP